jgi:hypothetical protein
MMGFRSAALVLACGLGACQNDLACTADPRQAIIATILDSVSGARAAFHATLIAQGRHTYDSVTADEHYYGADSTLSEIGSGGSDESGIYDVRVRKDGYRLWQQHDVRVSGGACGAKPFVRITARLQATP